MQRISQAPHAETFGGPTDLEPARFQVAYWTDDARTLPAAEKSIRAALDGIAESFTDSVSDDSEPPASGEARAYATRFEVEIWGIAQEV